MDCARDIVDSESLETSNGSAARFLRMDAPAGRTGSSGRSALRDGGVEGSGIAGIVARAIEEDIIDGAPDLVVTNVEPPMTDGAFNGREGLFLDLYSVAK